MILWLLNLILLYVCLFLTHSIPRQDLCPESWSVIKFVKNVSKLHLHLHYSIPRQEHMLFQKVWNMVGRSQSISQQILSILVTRAYPINLISLSFCLSYWLNLLKWSKESIDHRLSQVQLMTGLDLGGEYILTRQESFDYDSGGQYVSLLK